MKPFENQKVIIQAKIKAYEPMSSILDTIEDELDEDTSKMYDDVAPAT